jgi:gliding motility-associated lipoprotein GldH
MMNKILIISVLVLLATLFLACENESFFEQKKEVANADFWTYNDSIRFDFDLSDTSVTYNLMVDVEHAEKFAFENLYVKIHTIFPSGKQLGKLKSLQLIAPTGGWIGRKSRESVRTRIVLQDHTVFKEPGHYSIVFEQFMRRDSLYGIHAIGLAVEKTTEKRVSKSLNK